MKQYDQLFIGGEWVRPSTSATVRVVSPRDEATSAAVPEGREADIDRAVASAREAFDHGPWPRMSPSERADVMAALLGQLQMKSAELDETITREMGCPISFSNMGQVMATNMVLDYYV